MFVNSVLFSELMIIRIRHLLPAILSISAVL